MMIKSICIIRFLIYIEVSASQGKKKKKDYLPGIQKGYKGPNAAYPVVLASMW